MAQFCVQSKDRSGPLVPGMELEKDVEAMLQEDPEPNSAGDVRDKQRVLQADRRRAAQDCCISYVLSCKLVHGNLDDMCKVHNLSIALLIGSRRKLLPRQRPNQHAKHRHRKQIRLLLSHESAAEAVHLHM